MSNEKLNPYKLPEYIQDSIISGKVVPLFHWNKKGLTALHSMLEIMEKDTFDKWSTNKEKQLTGRYITILKQLIRKKEVIQCSLRLMNEKLN